MMSKNDERKIIDSLANDETVEMKSDDLVQMLNTELSKPESEIDGQLVKEILEALEPSEPDLLAETKDLEEKTPEIPAVKQEEPPLVVKKTKPAEPVKPAEPEPVEEELPPLEPLLLSLLIRW